MTTKSNQRIAALTLAFGASLLLAAGCAGGMLQDPQAPLNLNQTAPDFELADINGQSVRLSSLTEQGPTAVVFYRGHW